MWAQLSDFADGSAGEGMGVPPRYPGGRGVPGEWLSGHLNRPQDEASIAGRAAGCKQFPDFFPVLSL